jgi:hypothetical protein
MNASIMMTFPHQVAAVQKVMAKRIPIPSHGRRKQFPATC